MSIKATQLEDGTLNESVLDTATLAKLNAGTNPIQVASGERIAGTEVALRSFSPDDIAVMVGLHGMAPALSAVLSAGAITGANDISVSTGQSILGVAELTLNAASGSSLNLGNLAGQTITLGDGGDPGVGGTQVITVDSTTILIRANPTPSLHPGELSFQARGSNAIPLNAVGAINLTTTATSLVGAINELAGAGGGGGDLSTTLGLGNTAGSNGGIILNGSSDADRTIAGGDADSIIVSGGDNSSGGAGNLTLRAGASAAIASSGSLFLQVPFGYIGGSMLLTVAGGGPGGSGTLGLDGPEITLATAGVARLRVDGSGHMTWDTDNTLDIGASGATRPRSGYFGTSVVAGDGGDEVAITLDAVTSSAALSIVAEGGGISVETPSSFDIDIGVNGDNDNLTLDAGSDIFIGGDKGPSVALGAAGGNVGFYGSTGAGKQTLTGAKAGNAALTSVIAALVTMGMVTDTTT